MDNFFCAGYYFHSMFDSGNLGKVQFVKKFNETPDSNENFNGINVEFNLWTRPDCGGTQYENANRTWFYFSVKGGKPSHVAKFNIMNLNRQAKLYSQGMHPVIRIGPNGKWERIRDKPLYCIQDDNFIVSFLHYGGENTDVEFYYAFTFPYTYTEMQDYLLKLDKRFQRKSFDIKLVVRNLEEDKSSNLSSEASNKKAVNVPKDKESASEVNVNAKMSNISNDDSKAENSVINSSDDNISNEKLQQQNVQTFGSILDCLPNGSSNKLINDDNTKHNSMDEDDSELTVSNIDYENEIYYYRELLTYSIENKRVDLLTITSYHNIQEEHEERIKNLFPEQTKLRCHTFKEKKIIFLSSRVHPGETPASFVLNGFLNLLVDRKSVIASTLRKLYVFKIVPFLNPDGVFNGLYRSDTLGHNLNRVYLTPDLGIHPSIYAVRKLIRFYHFGFDKIDIANEPEQILPLLKSSPSCEKLIDIESNYGITALNDFTTGNLHDLKENVLKSSQPTTQESDSDYPSDTVTEKSGTSSGADNIKSTSNSISNSSGKIFTDKLIPEIKPIIHNSGTTIHKAIVTVRKPNESVKEKKTVLKTNQIRSKSSDSKLKNTVINSGSAKILGGGKKLIPKKEFKSHTQTPLIVSARYRPDRTGYQVTSNINISSEFQTQIMDDDKTLLDDKSKLFLYIDMHGHASKKGVFMYGNHMPNSAEAVECMLLPRLMSMNCHHFHFDACNFSERNMYHKGKRDGLSKEGSGRVAIYKTTGLIKSYTLECNYNTGKCVNILPPRGKETAMKAINLVPPKYTPAIFEEVGRALGPSILDLTNSNPLSRLPNSDFRTLQGLRNAMRTEIDKSFSKNHISKAIKGKTKRLKNIAVNPPIEISKENKAYCNMPWDVGPSGSNTGASITPRITAKGSLLTKNAAKPQRKLLNKSQSTTFGKKETVRKKGKVLCETSVATSKPQEIVKTKESQSQVPTKRIKVATQMNIKVEQTTHIQEEYVSLMEDVASKLSHFLPPTTLTETIFSGETSKILKTTDCKLKSYPTTNSLIDLVEKTSDLDVPCCSHDTKRSGISYYQKIKKTTSYLGISTSVVTNPGTMKSSIPVKIPPVLTTTTSLPTATASRPMTSGLKKSATGGDNKLKKKRTLKTDPNIKRKKSRVKAVWH